MPILSEMRAMDIACIVDWPCMYDHFIQKYILLNYTANII